MDFLCNTVTFWKDFWQELQNNKLRAVLCALSVVLGVTVGCVLFANDFDWQSSRYDVCYKLIYGGFFAVAMPIAVQCVLLYLCGSVSLLQRWTTFVIYFYVVVSGAFHGGTAVCLVSGFGVVGIGYLAVVLLQCACDFACCFVIANSCKCQRTFAEALFDAKSLICVLLCSFLAQISVIFLILRPITNLI